MGHGAGVRRIDFTRLNEVGECRLGFFLGDDGGADTGQKGLFEGFDHSAAL